MTNVIVFDIDGTLANGSHREHFIKLENGRTEKDWPSYFSLLHLDTLNEPVAAICRALERQFDILYLTARSGDEIEKTADWLEKYKLPCDVLYKNNLQFGPIYHRASGDFRDDTIVKLELLDRIKADGFNVIMIFEDRRRVVDAERAAGYCVAQVADGNF